MILIDGVAHLLDDGVPIPSVQSHFVKDTYYNILSVHDFPIIPNQDWSTVYPTYRDKMNRRIDRLLDKMETSRTILFVRWAANYDQAIELHTVLSKMVNCQFSVLSTNVVSLLDWGIERVCTVKVPSDPNRNATWDYVFQGVKIN